MNYTIENQYLSFTASSKGAEPQRILTASGNDYLWNGTAPYWSERAHHIFPWVARLFDERYSYRNSFYTLKIHGFLKDSEMEIVNHTEKTIDFVLESNNMTLAQYPFVFSLYVRYRLLNNRIMIRFEVLNRDEKTMFFAIGGHPGFFVPLEEKLNFEDYILEFSEFCNPLRAVNKNGLFTGNFVDFPLRRNTILDLRHDLFNTDAVMLKGMSRRVTLKSDRGSRSVTVGFPDFQYLGIWHDCDTEAPFVCIEPWTALQGRNGIIEDIEDNPDLISLSPRKTYINDWYIEVE